MLTSVLVYLVNHAGFGINEDQILGFALVYN